MNRSFLFFASVLFILSQTKVQAQNTNVLNKKNYKTWSISLGGGFVVSRADIKQYDWYPVGSYNNERRFGFYGSLTKQFTPVIGLQGTLLRGNISGTKRNIAQYFDADVWDYSLNAVINLRNLFNPGLTQKKHKFSYSFLIGAGLSQFKTKLKHQNGPLKDQTVYSFGYGEFGGPNRRTMESFMTVGSSIKYSVNKDFDLGFDLLLRNLNSDKLDAVVKDGNNDQYLSAGFSLTYHIGKRTSIPIERQDPTKAIYEQLLSLQNRVDSITKDSDGNGVPDVYEPKTGVASNNPLVSKVEPDTDHDSIPDSRDKEPFSNKNVRVDNEGKELDNDADGIPNSKDAEPNTPKGNLVNFQGKTIVADNKNAKEDGFKFENQPDIPNDKKVPTTAGRSSAAAAVNRVPVYFSLNNAAVSTKYIENLAQIALYLKANPDAKLRIIGHTDPVATSEYNYTLGLKRAQIVRDYLVRNFRIKSDRIITESRGETELLSPTINEVNRRVEVDVIR